MAHEEPAAAVDAHHEPDLDELDPDEPRTPLWMPLLGGALFLVAAIFLVATRPAGKTAEELSKDAAAQAAKAREAAQPAEAAEPAAPAPNAPAPARMPQPRAPGQGG